MTRCDRLHRHTFSTNSLCMQVDFTYHIQTEIEAGACVSGHCGQHAAHALHQVETDVEAETEALRSTLEGLIQVPPNFLQSNA